MTALIHSHDADGAAVAPDGRHRTSVHVRGGVGATRVDVEELRSIESQLEGVLRACSDLDGALAGAGRDYALDADLAPGPAAAARAAADEARDSWWGVRGLHDVAFETLMSVRYARLLYEEAEVAAQAATAAHSAVFYLRLIISPSQVALDGLGAMARKLALVGRIPGMEPTGPLGDVIDGLGKLVNAIHGDDDLPPDGIALDMAARELGKHGEYILPWPFLQPFPYDGRRVDPDLLTATQRLLLPITTSFHRLTGRQPGSATDLTLAVTPTREVPPAPDLPAVVDSLHAIHQDHGATPGTVEIRRTDHPDGTRTWTVMLPSTQAMGPGGRNPVDNLTNAETYSGLVSDVEIGAARAMEAAGIAPGEAVAVVGFSQGGLVAMRLAADPLVRSRFAITTVVTAGSPVAHVRTPEDTEVLHLEHLEDPIIGLDGLSNPAEAARTTVSRSLATGTTGELRFEVPPAESHSIAGYARTAELALEAGEVSVTHVSERLAGIAGGPGARVTAQAFTLERG